MKFDRFCLHWSCSLSICHVAVWTVEGSNSNAGKMDQTWSREYFMKKVCIAAVANMPYLAVFWEVRWAQGVKAWVRGWLSVYKLLSLPTCTCTNGPSYTTTINTHNNALLYHTFIISILYKTLNIEHGGHPLNFYNLSLKCYLGQPKLSKSWDVTQRDEFSLLSNSFFVISRYPRHVDKYQCKWKAPVLTFIHIGQVRVDMLSSTFFHSCEPWTWPQAK